MKNTKYRNKQGRFIHKLDYPNYFVFGLCMLFFILFLNANIRIVDNKPLIDVIHAQTNEVVITPPPLTIQEKICKAFGSHCDKALKIVKCESNFNPKAIGDRGLDPHSYGLFQIRAYKANSVFKYRPSIEVLLNEDSNIQWALKISGNGTNWEPWSCNKLI